MKGGLIFFAVGLGSILWTASNILLPGRVIIVGGDIFVVGFRIRIRVFPIDNIFVRTVRFIPTNEVAWSVSVSLICW